MGCEERGLNWCVIRFDKISFPSGLQYKLKTALLGSAECRSAQGGGQTVRAFWPSDPLSEHNTASRNCKHRMWSAVCHWVWPGWHLVWTHSFMFVSPALVSIHRLTFPNLRIHTTFPPWVSVMRVDAIYEIIRSIQIFSVRLPVRCVLVGYAAAYRDSALYGFLKIFLFRLT